MPVELDGDVPKVRRAAARSLGRLGSARAVLPLARVLEDHTEGCDLRGEAARSLGRLKDPRSLDPLTEILADKRTQRSLRAAVAAALGDLGRPEAVGPLLAAAALEDAGTALHVEKALVALGAPAVPKLAKALQDNRPKARAVTARAGPDRGPQWNRASVRRALR
jgi:HEAT repeat protein